MTSLCDKLSFGIYVTTLVSRLCDEFSFPSVLQVWISRPAGSTVSRHSTTGREPFLDAVLTAEELVILLGIAR